MKSLFFSFMIAACSAFMMTGCGGGGGDSEENSSLSITEQQFKLGNRSICLVSRGGVQLKFIVKGPEYCSGDGVFGRTPMGIEYINLSDVKCDEAGNIKSCVLEPTFQELKLNQSPILEFFQFPSGAEKDKEVSLGTTELKFQLDFTTGTYVLPLGEGLTYYIDENKHDLGEELGEDSLTGTLYVTSGE